MTDISPVALELPLTPLAGAEEVLRKKFLDGNPQWYADLMRFAFRLACFPHDVNGRAIADLAVRYPPRVGGKSPHVRTRATKDMIIAELGLRPHSRIRKKHRGAFFERRARFVRKETPTAE